MSRKYGLRIAVAAYLFLSTGLAYVTIKRHIGKDYSTLDIYFVQQEGVRLAQGENPYVTFPTKLNARSY
jgi:hypothetical protein